MEKQNIILKNLKQIKQVIQILKTIGIYKLIKFAEEFKELKILALCDDRGKDNDVKWVSIDIRDQIKKYIK